MYLPLITQCTYWVQSQKRYLSSFRSLLASFCSLTDSKPTGSVDNCGNTTQRRTVLSTSLHAYPDCGNATASLSQQVKVDSHYYLRDKTVKIDLILYLFRSIPFHQMLTAAQWEAEVIRRKRNVTQTKADDDARLGSATENINARAWHTWLWYLFQCHIAVQTMRAVRTRVRNRASLRRSLQQNRCWYFDRFK